MQKLTCALEFKEGRPVAKECNKYGEDPMINGYSGLDDEKYSEYLQRNRDWANTQVRLRTFEIGGDEIDKAIITHEYIGRKVIATIENNIVTKIELL